MTQMIEHIEQRGTGPVVKIGSLYMGQPRHEAQDERAALIAALDAYLAAMPLWYGENPNPGCGEGALLELSRSECLVALSGVDRLPRSTSGLSYEEASRLVAAGVAKLGGQYRVQLLTMLEDLLREQAYETGDCTRYNEFWRNRGLAVADRIADAFYLERTRRYGARLRSADLSFGSWLR